jgi:allophanate hydrolase subunit 2
MMVSAQACATAVAAYLAAGGDDASAPAVMGAMAISVLQDLGAMARRLDVGEAVIEAERDRAVAEDRAAVPRPRGGHLRAVT